MKGASPIKVLLGFLLTVVVSAVLLFGWMAFGDHSEIGVHRQSVDWLPASASDISFYRNNNIANVQAYEFRISRPDFEALAKERSWAIQPIIKEESILRYSACLPANHPKREEPLRMIVTAGFSFNKRAGNGGGTSVLYDTEKSKAYVFKNNR